MEGLEHYPFRFVRFVKPEVPCILQQSLYTFKSPKSNQTYWVWVEEYDHNFYGVKFHLKNHRYSEHKYELMTGFNEARMVIHTCIAITYKVFMDNPMASFGFIGADMVGEHKEGNKRLRVYRRTVLTFFSDEQFKHVLSEKYNGYMLIRRSALEQDSQVIEKLETIFSDNYHLLS